jgi:beta-lactamase superfamily II metal-dependent hydrolase
MARLAPLAPLAPLASLTRPALLARLAALTLLSSTAVACVDPVEEHDEPTAQEWAEGCAGELRDEAPVYEALPLVNVPADAFVFTTLDIGQGDAAILRTPSGCAALFDGGPTGAGATVKANLAALGMTRIDAAFVSHYHADHMGGIDEIEQGADGVPITRVYDRGGTYATVAYSQYASQFAGRRTTTTAGQVIDLCDEVTLSVIAVNGNGVSASDENAKSLLVKARFGAIDLVVGGDLTGNSPDIESRVAAAIGEVEVYKVHHHGSSTSSNLALVGALRPTTSFISLGASNAFGHPAPQTLANLNGVGSEIWQTEDPATGTKRGHVTLTSTTGIVYEVSQGLFGSVHAAKGYEVTGQAPTPTTRWVPATHEVRPVEPAAVAAR